MSSINVMATPPSSPTKRIATSEPASGTTAVSSSSQAKKTTGSIERFVRPASKHPLDSMEVDVLNSSLPRYKKSKIDVGMGLLSTNAILLLDDSLSFKAEKAVGLLAASNGLVKSNVSTPLKPIQAFPLQIKSKEELYTRQTATMPSRILSAPGLKNDYYSNVVDWSSTDILAIALGDAVHLFNAKDGRATLLRYTFDCTIGAVAFDPKGLYLAVGTKNNLIHFFNLKNKKLIKALRYPAKDGHINALAWHPVRSLISVGTSEGYIYHFIEVFEKNHGTLKVQAHRGDVCVLKWRPNGSLLASGGNDTHVRVWRMDKLKSAICEKQHRSAVKALAWCPWDTDLLASGGGRFDKKIHVWNLRENTRVRTFEAGSQVTSLHWSKHYKELVSSHGKPNPYICVWDYITTKKKSDIPAHKDRILHSAMNPSSENLVTLSSDESMKFWDIFNAHSSAPLPDERLVRKEARRRFIEEARQEAR